MTDFIGTIYSDDEEEVLDDSGDEIQSQNNGKKKAKDAFVWDDASDPIPDKLKRTLNTGAAERFSALGYKIADRLQQRKIYGKPSVEYEESSSDSDDDNDDDDDEDDDEEEEDDEDDEDDDEEEEEEEEEEEDNDSEEEEESSEEESKPSNKKAKKQSEDAPKTKSKVIKASKTATPLPTRTTTFEALKFSRPFIRAVRELNWVTPTPVQAMAIPAAMAGRDLMVNAVTGSGKTAAFMLPILERLLYRPKRVSVTRVMVVTPTRELAAQINETTLKMCKYTDIRTCLIVGGLSSQAQEVTLRGRPDILICTPGRMIDHIRNTPAVHMDDIEILVLDEADRLLELGFSEEVAELVKSCPRGRQTMLFSATLTDTVQDLVNLSLNNPQRISVDPFNSIVQNLTQEFIRIRQKDNATREAMVLSLCRRNFKNRVIVFCPSKAICHRLAIIFGLTGFSAAELHGNLTQAQRLDALDRFSQGEVDYMICTDVASRGLDIKNVQTVINYSMPRLLSAYIHRVGRTARAGRKGCAVTLAGDDQRKELKEVLKRVDGVKSRQVPSKVVSKYRKIIHELKGDIESIVQQEMYEKAERVADMEAHKAENLIRYEDEIYSRPAKTWFQTPQERLASKFSSERISNQPVKEKKEQTEKERRDQERADAKKKRDPLAGLTRKKRRRKMMMMEAEEMAKEQRAAAAAGDENAITYLRTANEAKRIARNVKTKKNKTKDQLDQYLAHSLEQDMPRKKGKKKTVMAKRFYADEEGESTRFDGVKVIDDSADKKKKKKKGPGSASFKSKKRFKRR